MPLGLNTVAVAHGLGATPSVFSLMGTHAEVDELHVENVGAVNFDIVASAAVTANRDIYWEAKVR
jgi:hypothetical protein